jgi:hypothetical protein
MSLINQEYGIFASQTFLKLQAATTCLFGENIGVGNVITINDLRAITTAAQNGDALAFIQQCSQLLVIGRYLTSAARY